MNELSKPADVKTPEEIWYEELFNFRPDPENFVGYQYHDHQEVDISRRNFKECSIVRLDELRLKYKGDSRLDGLRKRFEGLPDGLYIKRSSQLIPGADSCFWFEDDRDDTLTRKLKSLTSETGLLLQELTTGATPEPQKEAAQAQAHPSSAAANSGAPIESESAAESVPTSSKTVPAAPDLLTSEPTQGKSRDKREVTADEFEDLIGGMDVVAQETAARALGCSPRTIRNYIAAQKLTKTYGGLIDTASIRRLRKPANEDEDS